MPRLVSAIEGKFDSSLSKILPDQLQVVNAIYPGYEGYELEAKYLVGYDSYQ